MRLQSFPGMFRVRSKLHIVPSIFLFIELLNIRPEFEGAFMDFHASLVSLFVMTFLACVATLQLPLCLHALLWLYHKIYA